jgi:tRNA threonylcarbamoyladenosine biosynthesis protein TsaE
MWSIGLNKEASSSSTHLSGSDEETRAIGYALGQRLPANSVVCFFGDLGAGKTTFIKGLASGAAGIKPEEVQSPTFVYLTIHQGILPVYHFDLYRLHDAEEFISMGFDEYLHADGICCVEWSERIVPLLPKERLEVHLLHQGVEKREITVKFPCNLL